MEAGVGTGQNLPFYDPSVELLGIDLSATMLRKAAKRARTARCAVELRKEDATSMTSVPSSHFDWVLSTFMCCVMPRELHPPALEQLARVLKPAGRLRLVEMVFSKQPAVRRRQELLAGFVETVYGARFDPETLRFVEESPQLDVVSTRYLKGDTYLLIDARRRS